MTLKSRTLLLSGRRHHAVLEGCQYEQRVILRVQVAVAFGECLVELGQQSRLLFHLFFEPANEKNDVEILNESREPK